MEKRVFLAIFLSFLVLAAYQAYFAPAPPPPGVPESVAPNAATSPAPATTPASPPATSADADVPTTVLTPAPVVADAAARDIVVETDTVRAVFSTAGATLRSWQLKRYLEDGAPLELVPIDVPESFPRPFTLSTTDAAISKTLAAAFFKPSAEGLSLGAAAGTLTFEYRDESGLTARKTFEFQPEGKPYVLKVQASVDLAGASRPVTLAWGPGLGLGYSPDGSSQYPVRAVQHRAGDVEYLTAANIEEQGRYEGQLLFAGIEDHYFLATVLPGAERVTVDYRPVTLPVPNNTAGATRAFVSFSVSVPGSFSQRFFLGPKDFDILRDVEPQLVRAIDFGMFAALVVPLLLALKWINGFIHNYGWSIVVLTILINLVIFPLRHRSMVSMRKMQSLQPEIKSIQDRYAKYKLTDPERQKMNQEMMALYKQKGVNPASGCVPMLLTLPVLFAFYAMLSVAIELRGAPFVGWIRDLSRHDPLYITPVLMGLTQFWQMRMTPTTADPVQARMFMMMPIIFMVTSLWFPAGLVLYWFVSNLLAIGQQYLTNRIIGAPPAPPPRPTVPAKAKGAGNGGSRKS
jgi:YidC/Oxa1 family membrane protein insertase